jgi:hypothetical protein
MDISIFSAFTFANFDLETFAINVFEFEGTEFTRSHPGGIEGDENGLMFQKSARGDESFEFIFRDDLR